MLGVVVRRLRRDAGDAGRHLLLLERLHKAELVFGSDVPHEGGKALHF